MPLLLKPSFLIRQAILFIGLAALVGIRADAQIGQDARSTDGVWERVEERAIPRAGERAVQARAYATYHLDKLALDQVLQRAPMEFSLESGVDTVLTLPLPNGRFARFRIEQSPILAPEIARQFPEIKTYRAQGIDDPTATARFDWTGAGFHAIVFSQAGTIYVDPYAKGDTAYYLSYYKQDLLRQPPQYQCLVSDQIPSVNRSDIRTLPLNNGTTLKTYRIAIAATAEYTARIAELNPASLGGPRAAALSQITTTLNRVDGIYERDLAVRLTLVSGTNVIYTNAATDGYSNSNGPVMLDQNQSNLDSVLGTGAYDIGHVFSTGGGGIASLNSVCSVSRKAMGVTGSSSPTGDAYDVDYVAHEVGHQFGANHSFNSASSSCGGGNRESTQAYEPGSGVTIMAYAGICAPENLAAHSLDSFNAGSLDEITTFLASSSGGAACGTSSATGNSVPTVSAGSSVTIPKSTPFALTATGSDSNGDTLTYSWEEFDLGSATSSAAANATDTGQPLFRPYSPLTSASRTFPNLAYILNNANVPPTTYTGGTCSGLGSACITGETLPTMSRTMTFAVVARDNRASGGGLRSSTTTVTVSTGAGPFAVTSPNTAVTVAGNSTQTITWNVANTTAAPVSASNVRILLSTDGGTTFATTLASSTSNDGSESVTVPNTATTTARVKVEAVGNVFFDISDANFTITQSSSSSGGSGSSSSSSSSAASTGIVDFTPRPLDLNGDGRGDLFSYNATSGAWRWDIENGALKLGDPTIRTLVSSTSSRWDSGWTVKAADFNNDGRTDLFLYSTTTGRWFKAINNGANNFTYYTEVTSAGYSVGIGNFGPLAGVAVLDDVFFINPTTGGWAKCISIGDGTAGFSCDTGSWDAGWQIHPVDVTNDGFTDLLLYNPTSGVRLLAYPAASGFTYSAAATWSANWGITPGSYDTTAGNDFVLYNSTTGQWFVIRGTTLGTVGSGTWSANWTLRSGDLNGDGLSDVFLYNATTGEWFECFSNGAGDFTYASGRWDPGWQISVTSFNGDARADLLLYNSGTGTYVQCINTGSARFTYYAGSIGTGMTVLAARPSP